MEDSAGAGVEPPPLPLGSDWSLVEIVRFTDPPAFITSINSKVAEQWHFFLTGQRSVKTDPCAGLHPLRHKPPRGGVSGAAIRWHKGTSKVETRPVATYYSKECKCNVQHDAHARSDIKVTYRVDRRTGGSPPFVSASASVAQATANQLRPTPYK